MRMAPTKYYWIALVVLLAVHSLVAYGSYCLFTYTTRPTPEGQMVTASARELQESQKAPYGITTYHFPLPVILYVLLGYLALLAAAAIGVFAMVRGHPTFCS